MYASEEDVRNPFKPRRNVIAMLIIQEPGLCYTLDGNVVKRSSLKGCNVMWLADKVYDLRTNSVRDLAAERAQLRDKTAKQSDLECMLNPMIRSLRR